MRNRINSILLSGLIIIASIILGLQFSQANRVISMIKRNRSNTVQVYNKSVVGHPVQELLFRKNIERYFIGLSADYSDGKLSNDEFLSKVEAVRSLSDDYCSMVATRYYTSSTTFLSASQAADAGDYIAAAESILAITKEMPDYGKAQKLFKNIASSYASALSDSITSMVNYGAIDNDQVQKLMTTAERLLSDKQIASISASTSSTLFQYLSGLHPQSVAEWSAALQTLEKLNSLMYPDAVSTLKSSMANEYCNFVDSKLSSPESELAELITLQTTASVTLGSEPGIQEAGSSLNNAYVESVLTQISPYQATNDYSSAEALLKKAMVTLPGEQRITDMYIETVMAHVKELSEAYDYPSAETLLKDVMEIFPGDQRLTGMLIQLQGKKPDALSSLAVPNSGFILTTSEVRDAVGNVYEGENVYTASIESEGKFITMVVKLNGQYSHLHGWVAVNENNQADDGTFGVAIFPGDAPVKGTELVSTGAMAKRGGPVELDLDLRGLDSICIYFNASSGWVFSTASIILNDWYFYRQ